MRNHGTDPSHRFALMREQIEAMKAIWSEDEASYSGKYVNFERIWCWPKPLQQPHPPVLVGGNGPHVLDRVLAFGDEWMPNRVKDEEIIPRFEELASPSEAEGRDPIPITVAGMMRDPARIERFERAGVHRGRVLAPGHRARRSRGTRSTATRPRPRNTGAPGWLGDAVRDVALGRARIWLHHLHQQGRPTEVDRAHADAAERVVVLAQPGPSGGAGQPVERGPHACRRNPAGSRPSHSSQAEFTHVGPRQ